MKPVNILTEEAHKNKYETITTELLKGTKDEHLHIEIPSLNKFYIKRMATELWFNEWYEGKCEICKYNA